MFWNYNYRFFEEDVVLDKLSIWNDGYKCNSWMVMILIVGNVII